GHRRHLAVDRGILRDGPVPGHPVAAAVHPGDRRPGVRRTGRGRLHQVAAARRPAAGAVAVALVRPPPRTGPALASCATANPVPEGKLGGEGPPATTAGSVPE